MSKETRPVLTTPFTVPGAEGVPSALYHTAEAGEAGTNVVFFAGIGQTDRMAPFIVQSIEAGFPATETNPRALDFINKVHEKGINLIVVQDVPDYLVSAKDGMDFAGRHGQGALEAAQKKFGPIGVVVAESKAGVAITENPMFGFGHDGVAEKDNDTDVKSVVAAQVMGMNPETFRGDKATYARNVLARNALRNTFGGWPKTALPHMRNDTSLTNMRNLREIARTVSRSEDFAERVRYGTTKDALPAYASLANQGVNVAFLSGEDDKLFDPQEQIAHLDRHIEQGTPGADRVLFYLQGGEWHQSQAVDPTVAQQAIHIGLGQPTTARRVR
jgi:hypothetical protein